MKTFDRGLRVSLLAIVISALGACSTQKIPVAAHAVAYNRAVASSQDGVLLLNVLRARDGLPMHFTSLTDISGQTTVTGGVDITLPLSGPISGTGTATPSVGVQTGPTYNVVVENKEKFVNGLLNPVSLDILDRYMVQAWPRDLLFHMFFSKIEIRVDLGPARLQRIQRLGPRTGVIGLELREIRALFEAIRANAIKIDRGQSVGTSAARSSESPPAGVEGVRDAARSCFAASNARAGRSHVIFTFIGEPRHPSFACYQRILFIAAEFDMLRVAPRAEIRRFGPPMTLSQATAPAVLSQLVAGKLTIGCYFPRRVPGGDVRYEKCQESQLRDRRARYFAVRQLPDRDLVANELLHDVCRSLGQRNVTSDAAQKRISCGQFTLTFSVQSIHGMLHFLGRTARIKKPGVRLRKRPLLELVKGREAFSSGGIYVRYRGVPYALPKDGSHGLEALALVAQLLGLNRTSDETSPPTQIRLLR